jgi:2'-5' RNA ligase
MKKRLFIAIPLPEDARQILSAYRKGYANLKARWTAEENLHITLYFCGDTDEEKIPALQESLGGVKFEEFSVEFQKILFAPPDRPPRMIWAEFKSCREFAELTQKVYEAARPFLRAPQPPHPHLTPHITLARFRDPRAAAGVILKQLAIDRIEVKQYDLMQSHLGTNGPSYKLLKSYALT